MTDFPDIKIKTITSFPAAVYGGAGIALVNQSGTYTFSIDFTEYPVVASIPSGDLPNTNVLTYNVVTKAYFVAPYGSGGSFTEPPSDAKVYGRRNTGGTGAWSRAVDVAGDTMTGALSITDATPSTSYINGALTVAGGVGIGGDVRTGTQFVSHGFPPTTNHLKSAASFIIAGNSNGPCCPSTTGGIVIVNDVSVSGLAAMFFVGNAVSTLFGGTTGHLWSATTTPAANHFGLAWNGAWNIYNGFASTVTFRVLSLSLT